MDRDWGDHSLYGLVLGPCDFTDLKIDLNPQENLDGSEGPGRISRDKVPVGLQPAIQSCKPMPEISMFDLYSKARIADFASLFRTS